MSSDKYSTGMGNGVCAIIQIIEREGSSQMEGQRISRRDFMKTCGLSVLALTGMGNLIHAKQSARRPNVILIFSDDQGTIDVNCFGADDLYTPNLDALAGRGVRFTQFYVNAAICSPSRAALMTGRYPQRAELVRNAGGQSGMPAHQVTIAEMLKENGYRTGIFGKWHLGEVPELSPNAQGFDEFVGHKVGCIDNYSHFFYWSGPNRHDLWRDEEEYWEDGKYFPDMVVREAHRFMEENRNNPFFLYLPFNLPHYPLQGEAEFREKYKDVEKPRSLYAAFVSTLDEKIGQVIDKVDELGIREDTIIIFLSDHGHSVEVRTFSGGGNSGPFRGHKFTFWEGGIRVPCIISWPGHIPEGEVRGQMAIAMDLMPTISHYCDVGLPDHKIDGENIATAIGSASALSPHKVLHWEVPIGKSGKSQWAIREGNWKLVVNGPATEYQEREIPAEEIFLSNLAKDPGETINLAKDYPEVVKELTASHNEWAEEVKKR
jgi:arylsulfatase A